MLPSVLRFLRDQAYQLRASPKTYLEVVYPLLSTGIEILLKILHNSFYTIITLKKKAFEIIEPVRRSRHALRHGPAGIVHAKCRCAHTGTADGDEQMTEALA